MSPKVGMWARRVVWAAMGQGECVPMHGGRDIGLWSPVGKVAIPFLVAGTKMLDLEERNLISFHQHRVCLSEPLDDAISMFSHDSHCSITTSLNLCLCVNIKILM